VNKEDGIMFVDQFVGVETEESEPQLTHHVPCEP
jgi:hypothetical protein